MTLTEVRKWFPSLATGFAYMENAGGSQVPGVVPEAVQKFLLSNNVQLGASYPQSVTATAIVDEAHEFMASFLNGTQVGRTVLGPSATILIQLIANASADVWAPGDEVVIAASNHEANAGAWERLTSRGIRVRTWPLDTTSFRCELRDLIPLLSERTRLVAVPHVSNLLGQIEDVRAVAEEVHKVGAQIFVDGVAYAPHRAIDVAALGVDWYTFSCYKVYGPHMAALFGTTEAFDRLTGPNHSFVPNDSPYKWELGGVSHEACAGLVALKSYFGFLADQEYSGFAAVDAAFQTVEALEREPEARLRAWLASQPEVDLIGPRDTGPDTVPTISFVHRCLASDEIARRVGESGIGIRNGNMYAVRLLDALSIPHTPGVVRISLVHYNTLEEVERLITCLEDLFR